MRAITFVHWVLGRPWSYGAAGPHEWDCFYLFRAFQTDVMGRKLEADGASWETPHAAARSLTRAQGRGAWRPTDCPVLGDAVEFLHGALPYHIGIYLPDAGGSVLHSSERAGVVVDQLRRLEAAGQDFRISTYVAI